MARSDSTTIVSSILLWAGAVRPLFVSAVAGCSEAFALSAGACLPRTELKPVWDYVRTALGDPEPEELAEMLQDEDCSERETFLEFLLFPDDALRRALEPNLSIPLSSESIAEVVAELEETGVSLRLLLTPEQELLVPVPDWMWEGVVNRLQLSADIGGELLALVEAKVPAQVYLAVRLLLRSTRWLTETRTLPSLLKRGYVYRFFQLYPPTDPFYLYTLTLWLRCLGELEVDAEALPSPVAGLSCREVYGVDGMKCFGSTGQLSKACLRADPLCENSVERSKTVIGDLPLYRDAVLLTLAGSAQDEKIWKFLVERQRSLAKALRGNRDFVEKLKRYNMEILMMQGGLSGYVSEEATRNELRCLQRLSLAILGRPVADGEEVAELLLNLLCPEPDVFGSMLRLDDLLTGAL